MKQDILTVKHTTELLTFLFSTFENKSKTTIKSYLSNRQISINNIVTTQFNESLSEGDIVTVSYGRQKESLRHPMLKVIYEDDDIIIVNKKSGLLSIATDKQPLRTAYNIVGDYMKRDDPTARIFVVHRLDRETSGIMLFAKNEVVKNHLQHNWNDTVLERKYYAVTEGVIPQDTGVIESYLTESKSLKVYATTKEEGKLARTAFKVLKRSKKHTLLELQLETGRKNQIRAHLEYVGYPIIGDKKYGSKTAPIRRVALHAGSLIFLHPKDNKEMRFETPIPLSFSNLF